MEHQDGSFDSHLSEKTGISQPPVTNPHFKAANRRRKRMLSVDEYVSGITSGNLTILSQAITLVESNLPDHQKIALEIIRGCLPHTGKSVRLGITGVPGVGKSTFIESFGTYLTSQNHKVAVLAIDPSSERTKGSILGDKTRMEHLSTDPNAFIRPSPSAGSLGGVARKTRETILLCEAAGFNYIIVETVGVGQSETVVRSMVDFFLLLMLSGAGDELQGIKRGIMEMADSIAITKADGSNVDRAKQARVQYENALHLFPMAPSEWRPKVVTCSSVNNVGLSDICDVINEYASKTSQNGFFDRNRLEQAKFWLHESIDESLKKSFYGCCNVKESMEQFEKDVVDGKISSFEAADKLMETYLKSR